MDSSADAHLWESVDDLQHHRQSLGGPSQTATPMGRQSGRTRELHRFPRLSARFAGREVTDFIAFSRMVSVRLHPWMITRGNLDDGNPVGRGGAPAISLNSWTRYQ
ncbi:hypothetical protein D3C80_1511770 [compost metagenome]